MNDKRAISTICVAGAGIVGLSAAAAFGRALPRAQLTIIKTPPDPAALADILPTSWPSVARFHAAIGLDERDLVRKGVATHHLGTLFDDWPGAWTHAFGRYGKPVGAIPFDHIWAQAQCAGKALPYDHYSMGAALARAGKFSHPSANADSVTSRFGYGLRLDPPKYQEQLRALLPQCRLLQGDIGAIEQRESGVEAVQLTDGERIAADLFVDATGPAARLIGALGDSVEDWSDWMPFDRIAMREAERGGAPMPCDRVRAFADRWTIEWQMHGRTITAQVGWEGTAIRRQRRLRPWVRNVLALGDAATALDPLHGFNLALAQEAILLALELLPSRDFLAVETNEYNRRAEQLTRRVRDFVALHYLRSGRRDGFWCETAAREPPVSLARTLDQFGYRGRMPFHEDEIVTRDSWTAALLGLGPIPRNVDPQTRAIPLDKAIPAIDRLAHEIEQMVARVPSYAEYLRCLRS